MLISMRANVAEHPPSANSTTRRQTVADVLVRPDAQVSDIFVMFRAADYSVVQG
ncbi:MAG: hypothetical protein AAGJ91_09350 [Pseudomonadota bacterium]